MADPVRQESPSASVPDRPDPAEGGGDPADRQALAARLLGCGSSVGTVKTHAHRGLRTLRESLGDLGEFAVNETARPEGENR